MIYKPGDLPIAVRGVCPNHEELVVRLSEDLLGSSCFVVFIRPFTLG